MGMGGGGAMLSLNRVSSGDSGKYAYVVACQVQHHHDDDGDGDGDGGASEHQHHFIITKSKKFDCNGFDDLEAHSRAIWFCKATDSVSQFRAFLFDEPWGSSFSRVEQGTVTGEGRMGGASTSSSVAAASSGSETKIIKGRSFLCMREKQQLMGVRFAVAMCRLENSRLRSISFCCHSNGREVDAALEKAEHFLRSAAFDNWRRQQVLQQQQQQLRSREQAGGGAPHRSSHKERGLKHAHSFVGIEKGEKIDCVCGKNRSYGLMMACERCGAWEHAECQGFRSKLQIPADYICSVCVRAEGEEVIIIRCEEQGSYWNVDLENVCTGLEIKEQEQHDPICCVCGCEDNEDFEALIRPCACDGCSSLAHPSCISVTEAGASQRKQRLQGTGMETCFFCRGTAREATRNSVPTTESSRSVQAEQMTMARKRLRSTAASGGALEKGETVEKKSAVSCKNEKDELFGETQLQMTVADSKKSASPFLGRRFSDAAANVPIKKRRIQLEMARSPSPPLNPTSPKGQPDMPSVRVPESKFLNCSENTEELDFVTVGQVCDNTLSCDGVGKSVRRLDTGKSGGVGENLMKEKEGINIAALSTGLCHPVEVAGRDVMSLSKGKDVGPNARQAAEALKLESAAECGTEKSQLEYQQSDLIREAAKNSTYSTGGPSAEGCDSLCSEVDLQQQQFTAAEARIVPSLDDKDLSYSSKCVEGLSDYPPTLGLSKTGDTGLHLEEVVQRVSRKGEVSLRDLPDCKLDSPCPSEGKKRARKSKGVDGEVGDICPSFVTSSNLDDHACGMEEDKNVIVGGQSLAEKSNCIPDDRLHWDLNMDMEEWERPSEENKAVTAHPDLSVLPEVVKEKSMNIDKEFGAADSVSTVFQGGRLEQGCLERIQDGTECVMVSTSDANGGFEKPGKHMQEKHESSLVLAESCSNSSRDLEVRALAPEGQSVDISSVLGRESEVKIPLDMDETKVHAHSCSTSVTNSEGGPTCEGEAEDFFGACDVKGLIVDTSKGTADVLEPDRLMASKLSKIEHPKEETLHPIVVPSVTFPMPETSSASDVPELHVSAEDELEKVVDKEVMQECVKDRNESLSSPSRHGPITHKWEGNMLEDLEAENVDYGDSEIRDGDELESEERLQCGGSEVESTWKPVAVAGVCVLGESRKADALVASVSKCVRGETDDWTDTDANCGPPNKKRYQSGSGDTGVNHNSLHHRGVQVVGAETQNCGSLSEQKNLPTQDVDVQLAAKDDGNKVKHGNGRTSNSTGDTHPGAVDKKEDMVTGVPGEKTARNPEGWKRFSEGSSRVRTSGWDQLPEGFESAEEALQAARGSTGHAGRGSQHWSGVATWNTNSPHFNSSNSRFGSGHERGLVLGNVAAGDRVFFEDTAWSRVDHSHRCRVDDGIEMGGRGPSTQGSRQDNGGSARAGSLDSTHRHRRRETWIDDAGGAHSLWDYGPGRHLSPPSLMEPFGFNNPHKRRNAAAVAAAKVESSGLVVAPDGTVIKAGVASQGPLQGLLGKGRSFQSMGDLASNGAVPGVIGGRMKVGGDMDMRSRDCLDMRVAPDISMGTDVSLRYGGGDRCAVSFLPDSAICMPGTSRFRWSRPDRNFTRPVEGGGSFLNKRRQPRTCVLSEMRSPFPRVNVPPTPTSDDNVISDDRAASQPRKRSCTPVSKSRSESRPEPAAEKAESPSQAVPPPPKLPLPPPPPRAQRSPPAGLKRLISKRDDWPRARERSRDKDRDWDRDRERPSTRSHYSPPCRMSPHVIHGSALTDERDRLLLAGIDRSRDQSATGANPLLDAPVHSRSVERVSDPDRRPPHEEGRKQDAGSHLSRSEDPSPKSRVHWKEVSMKGEGDRRDSHARPGKEIGVRSQNASYSDSQREGQRSIGGGSRYSSTREGEDDVAPRRRRPS